MAVTGSSREKDATHVSSPSDGYLRKRGAAHVAAKRRLEEGDVDLNGYSSPKLRYEFTCTSMRPMRWRT